jgi:hypothetical protein
MRKYLLTLILLLIQVFAFTQPIALRKIDSLKRLATTSSHMKLVDIANFISEEYWLFQEYWGTGRNDTLVRSNKVQADSVERYALLAKDEASRINYQHGTAKALLNLCRSEDLRSMENRRRNIKSTADINKWEQNIEQLFMLSKEIADNELLGHAYYELGRLNGKRKENVEVYTDVDNYKKAVTYLLNSNKPDLFVVMICIYVYWGSTDISDYSQAFDYLSKGTEISKKLLNAINVPETPVPDNKEHRDFWLTYTLELLAELYQYAGGDYETAMDYLLQQRQYFLKFQPKEIVRSNALIGTVFLEKKQYDSALHYIKPFAISTPGNYGVKIQMGKLYTELKQYDSAWKWLQAAMETGKQRDHLELALPEVAKFYIAKNNYKDALKYAEQALGILNKINIREGMLTMTTYQLLSDIYHHLGKNNIAYTYLLKFMNLRDSLLNRQFLWKINSYKKQAEEERKTSQINLLNKDNQIKEQKLKQQAFLRNGLIIGIVLLLLLGVFIFRNLTLKRKNDKLQLKKDLEMQQLASEKKHAELQQQALELEMQALRAQMNPHFIFNCLSSINRFIFKNDNKLASDYLTRFSRLIRMVLMHSQKKLIPLEDELEMIRLYLDLERLRFKDAFDYSITTTNIVDAGTIFIPPLLLQPFCENAVWHGLMHKESKGHLNIIISEVISEHEKVLHCVIEDDGIGRDKATEMKSKSAENEKSMGLKITTERLALLNKENNFSTFYKIEDILNDEHEGAGTRVQLKIKYKESVEERV